MWARVRENRRGVDGIVADLLARNQEQQSLIEELQSTVASVKKKASALIDTVTTLSQERKIALEERNIAWDRIEELEGAQPNAVLPTTQVNRVKAFVDENPEYNTPDKVNSPPPLPLLPLPAYSPSLCSQRLFSHPDQSSSQGLQPLEMSSRRSFAFPSDPVTN